MGLPGAMAVNYYWTSNGTSPAVDGSGTWDTSTVRWLNSTNGTGATATFSNAQGNAMYFGNGGAGGTITVSSGTMEFSSLTFNNVTSGYTISGGALRLNTASASFSILTNYAGTTTIDSELIWASPMAKTGVGTLRLNFSNTSTARVDINGGILEVTSLKNGGVASNIGAGGVASNTLTFNSGTLRYIGTGDSSNRAFTVNANGGTLDASGSGALNLTAVTQLGRAANGPVVLTLTGTNGGNNTLSAQWTNPATSGASSLVKAGSGKWILTHNNTYTGTTSVNAGTLMLTGTGSIAGSTVVNVASGATLDISGVTGSHSFGVGQTVMGSGTIVGNTTVNGNLQPGSSPGVLSFSANLALSNSTVTTMEVGSDATRGTTYDGINVGNMLTYDGALVLTLSGTYSTASWNLFDFVSQTGEFDSVSLTGSYTGSLSRVNDLWTGVVGGQNWAFDEATGDLSVVPEPGTSVLLGLGGLAVLYMARRRRS